MTRREREKELGVPTPLTVRLTPKERALFEAAAKNSGALLSHWVRAALRRQATENLRLAGTCEVE